MARFFLTLLCVISIIVCEAQTATEYYNKGNDLKEEKKINEALTAYKEATNLDPKYAAAWYEMGWCSNDLKDYTGAITYLRKARPMWSTIPKVFFELGYAFEKTTQYDSATANFKRCLELKPDYSLAHKELGNVAYFKEEYTPALEYFKKYEVYAKTSITDYLYWYRRGFANNVLKNYEEAVVSLNKSKEIKADYINTHLELGFAASRLKQNDAAIAHYNKAIELDPKSYIPYNGIGEVYRDNIKNREESIRWYNKALAIKSNERKACFGIGYCLNSLERYSEAIPYLKTAIEQETTYTAAYVELGYSYYKTNYPNLALSNLNKALELNPKNENARYYSTLIYINQSNKIMAQKMVDELRSLNSKYVTELQEMINKM